MNIDPLDRRGFLGASGGAIICTLAGHRLSLDRPADVDRLAAGVPVPPKVAAAGAASARQVPNPLAPSTPSGQRREYWIRAETVKWNIVPTGRDQMMDKPVKGKHTFTAWGYRQYTANFASPMGPATIPGPLIEATTGDTVVVNFQNMLKTPVTMHPHGIFYANEMDGAYKGKYTDPGGFVQHGKTVQYEWEAHPGTEGSWLYHDHGPMDPVPVFKGLFGPLLIRKAGDTPADQDFFLTLHSFAPIATSLPSAFSCINGHAYAGNTPTLQAKVGQKVAWHVFALDNDFHTFHIHGHRWTDADGGGIIDTKVLGPAESLTAAFTEDNPGRWFYHCHVFSHLHMGMNGWYVVS